MVVSVYDIQRLMAFIDEHKRKNMGALMRDNPNQVLDICRYMRHIITVAPEGAVRQLEGFLVACGLDGNTFSTLPPGNERNRREYAAAIVLVTALVKGTTRKNMAHVYKLLMNYGGNENKLSRALSDVLSFGDEIESPMNKRILLRNFIGAEPYLRERYMFAAAYSFELAGKIIDRAYRDYVNQIRTYTVFLSKYGRLSPRILNAFRKYFGDPYATVDRSKIVLAPESDLPHHIYRTRGWFVRLMIEILYQNYRSGEPVTMQYGGLHGCYSGRTGYVFIRSNNYFQNTKIYLLREFFQTPLHRQAKNLIHELSHTWCFTLDHAYWPKCEELPRTNPELALSNAESYALFMLEAFGDAIGH